MRVNRTMHRSICVCIEVCARWREKWHRLCVKYFTSNQAISQGIGYNPCSPWPLAFAGVKETGGSCQV